MWFTATNCSSARAGIIGIVPGSNLVEFTFSVGGVPLSSSGLVPLTAYPGFSTYGDSGATAGFAGMDLAYHFSPAAARVIIPDTGPVAIASQGAPSPVDGPVEILADFAVSFAVDALGTAATTVPISYPIAFGGIAGTFVSFDAEVDYSSTLAGFLGTSELHFAFAGPGGSPLLTVSGPDLMLPALLPGDTLTLTGFFSLLADGFPGGSTEIEVFGAAVPEPSTGLLAVTACAGLAVLRRFRRRTRR